MNKTQQDIFELSHGELAAWVDTGASIHLKCVTAQGDPVELGADEVKALCEALMRLIREIE